MTRQSIQVRHNMEMAHRLFETAGKCEQIHGHSWWVTLEIVGEVDSKGLLGGLDFGEVKRRLRDYLDTNYDHHLLLNVRDPWSHGLSYDGEAFLYLPGLHAFDGDPTTENIARAIGTWAVPTFGYCIGREELRVEVWETATNCATWRYDAVA